MDKYERLSRSLLTVTILLIIQLILGLYLYLYVTIPSGTTSFVSYMSENPVLAAHVVMAFILVVVDFMAFFMAIHARIGNGYIFAVMISLVSIVLAGVGGIMYLMAGHLNLYSYLMAFFMVLAFACVGIANSGTRKAKS